MTVVATTRSLVWELWHHGWRRRHLCAIDDFVMVNSRSLIHPFGQINKDINFLADVELELVHWMLPCEL